MWAIWHSSWNGHKTIARREILRYTKSHGKIGRYLRISSTDFVENCKSAADDDPNIFQLLTNQTRSEDREQGSDPLAVDRSLGFRGVRPSCYENLSRERIQQTELQLGTPQIGKSKAIGCRAWRLESVPLILNFNFHKILTYTTQIQVETKAIHQQERGSKLPKKFLWNCTLRTHSPSYSLIRQNKVQM